MPRLLLQVGLHPSQPRKLAAHAPLEGVLLALQQRGKNHSAHGSCHKQPRHLVSKPTAHLPLDGMLPAL